MKKKVLAAATMLGMLLMVVSLLPALNLGGVAQAAGPDNGGKGMIREEVCEFLASHPTMTVKGDHDGPDMNRDDMMRSRGLIAAALADDCTTTTTGGQQQQQQPMIIRVPMIIEQAQASTTTTAVSTNNNNTSTTSTMTSTTTTNNNVSNRGGAAAPVLAPTTGADMGMNSLLSLALLGLSLLGAGLGLTKVSVRR